MAATRSSVLMTRKDFPQSALHKLRDAVDVDIFDGVEPISRDELLARIKGKDGLLCLLTEKIDAEVLDAAAIRSTEKLAHHATAVHYIPTLPYAEMMYSWKHDLSVGYTPGVLTNATAELTVALLLATARRLFDSHRELRNGGWLKCSWSPLWMAGHGLAGSTVGIFGLGRIGQAVLKRLSSFDVGRFLYCGTGEKQLATELPRAEFVSFDVLLRESDFVICTAALNEATKLKFDRKAFEAMKKTAVFINTSRGGLVDQEALIWALETEEIWAAGIDVMTPEPLPLDHPLTRTPHLSG